MTVLTRKSTVKTILAVIFAVSLIGEASAAVCNIYGFCVPVCSNVWVQTGPYPGQGYWTTVCN